MKATATIDLIRQGIATGKLTESYLLCQQIIEQAPDQVIAYQYMGQILEVQGEVAKAIHAYTKAISLQPTLVEVYACLGNLYSQIDNPREAIKYYRQALAYRPNWAELHFKLGNTFYQYQDLAKAVHSYRQAITYAPNYIKAFYNLGVVLEHQGQLYKAIQAYTQVIALQPEHLKAHCNLGCILIQQEKFEESILVFQRALLIAPNWAELHSNLGQALIGLKKTGAAIATFRRAIELQPDMALSHYNLGKVWQLEGYHTQAIHWFEQAIRLDPELEMAYSDCSASLLALQQLDLAVKYLQNGMKPVEFVTNYCREVSQIIVEDEMDRARIACAKFLTELQECGRSNPKSDLSLLASLLVQIYVHFGHVCFEYGDYGRAEVHYRQALKFKPDTPNLLMWLGDCLVKQQRLNDAVISYHLALGIQPEESETLFKLGQILEKLGLWEQAIAYYQKVWHLGDIDVQEQETESGRESIQGIYLHSQDWLDHKPALPVPASIIPIPPRDVCHGLNCMPCLKKLLPLFNPVYLGEGIYQCFHEKQNSRNLSIDPTLTVTKIPQGKVWIVPNENAWKVCNAIAILTEDDYLLADLSRDYPGQLPLCQQPYNPTQHLIFWQDALPKLESIKGTVAVLSGLSGNVYFHWMVDILPRLEVLHHHNITWEEIDWFLVNSCTSGFQRQTLEILGVPQHKILESDRHPYIQAQQLIVPSFASRLGWLSERSLQFLRETFLPKALVYAVNSSAPYPERIYITRAKAKYRKICNEVEVTDLLNQYGFISVALESISFLEQVALFAHAKVIVGAHGSGLTNTVFCNHGTTVVEIFSPNYIRQYFWVISQQLQLNHYYLLGEVFACYPLRQLMYYSPLVEDILVNLNQLRAVVELII